jgi:hypothetical protein
MSLPEKCPECGSPDVRIDWKTKEVYCADCGLVIQYGLRPEKLIPPMDELPVVEYPPGFSYATRVVEKRRVPGKGVRLLLAYGQKLPEYRGVNRVDLLEEGDLVKVKWRDDSPSWDRIRAQEVQTTIDGRNYVEKDGGIGYLRDAYAVIKKARHPFWNPVKNMWEQRRCVNIVYDASIPESVIRAYEYYLPEVSGERGDYTAEDRILLLLGTAGYPLQSSVIQEVLSMDLAGVEGLNTSTVANRLSKMASMRPYPELRHPLTVKSIRAPTSHATRSGPTVALNGDVYIIGKLNEEYRALTERGWSEFNEVIRRARLPALLGWEAFTPPEEEYVEPGPFTVPTPGVRAGGIELVGKSGQLYNTGYKWVEETLTEEEIRRRGIDLSEILTPEEMDEYGVKLADDGGWMLTKPITVRYPKRVVTPLSEERLERAEYMAYGMYRPFGYLVEPETRKPWGKYLSRRDRLTRSVERLEEKRQREIRGEVEKPETFNQRRMRYEAEARRMQMEEARKVRNIVPIEEEETGLALPSEILESRRRLRDKLRKIEEQRRLSGCTHPLILWSPTGEGTCSVCGQRVRRENGVVVEA